VGSRDYSHREKKKQKKDAKKISPVSVMTTPVEVEVIKKGKQREGRRVEEEEE
jgi:hypothetical protein